MLSPDRITDQMTDHAGLAKGAADYDVVRRAIAHRRENWREQPEIDTIAEAAGVTPTELHSLFRRWAGITPKAFLQALTLDRDVHAEFGIERLFLVSHGRKVAIANFLGAQEKQDFAHALAAALGEARRGPTRTVVE